MNKFWKWVRNKAPDPDKPDETIEERTLFLDGTIASESWFDDDVTPALFKYGSIRRVGTASRRHRSITCSVIMPGR